MHMRLRHELEHHLGYWTSPGPSTILTINLVIVGRLSIGVVESKHIHDQVHKEADFAAKWKYNTNSERSQYASQLRVSDLLSINRAIAN